MSEGDRQHCVLRPRGVGCVEFRKGGLYCVQVRAGKDCIVLREGGDRLHCDEVSRGCIV